TSLVHRLPISHQPTKLKTSMHFRHLFWLLAFCIYVASHNAATCNAADTALKSGIDRSNFDLSVKPGDDFYQYVNGTWIKQNTIPSEDSRWGAVSKLRDDTLLALREILDDLAKEKTPTPERRKL